MVERPLARVGLQHHIAACMQRDRDGLPHQWVTLNHQNLETTRRGGAWNIDWGQWNAEGCTEQRNSIDIAGQGGGIQVGHGRSRGAA